MSRAAQWVLSPPLPAGDHSGGVLQARCGELVAMIAPRFDEPPGRVCPHCSLIFLVESEGPRFARPDP